MSTAYLGEIRAFGFNFAPLEWALCNGQLLPVSQYEALYNLLGTTYGGDGFSTFGVPNLQGRVPMHQGTSSQLSTTLGQVVGTQNVTLTASEMPAHTHVITAAQIPSGGVVDRTPGPTPASYLSEASGDGTYLTNPPSLDATLANGAIGHAGGSLPHDNEQPYLVINFCVSLTGIYPSQT